MEAKEWTKILSMIQKIDEDTKQLTKIINDTSIPNRDNLLREIHREIIGKNVIFKDIDISNKTLCSENDGKYPPQISGYIRNTIINIKNNSAKRVFYLRKFLDKFSEISESDKKVVLQSLKNTDTSNLQEKMESLINIFGIQNLD
ncbi:MAG: hypothetical protein GF317_14575 [Candidatus Lokiarchaeota archaeon]|nr:hypothetical protein [Candidatus Lokiarchaeota archaeon]MBD3200832.1 hypothetical protein [Candidatus Lokiarchaeota archaeon]